MLKISLELQIFQETSPFKLQKCFFALYAMLAEAKGTNLASWLGLKGITTRRRKEP